VYYPHNFFISIILTANIIIIILSPGQKGQHKKQGLLINDGIKFLLVNNHLCFWQQNKACDYYFIDVNNVVKCQIEG